MKIVKFELFCGGNRIGATPIQEQAVKAAHLRAKATGQDVAVEALLDDGSTRKIVVKPDGKVDKVWQREGKPPIISGAKM